MGDGLVDLPTAARATPRLLWASQQSGFSAIVFPIKRLGIGIHPALSPGQTRQGRHRTKHSA